MTDREKDIQKEQEIKRERERERDRKRHIKIIRVRKEIDRRKLMYKKN